MGLRGGELIPLTGSAVFRAVRSGQCLVGFGVLGRGIDSFLLNDNWVICLQGCKEWSVLGRVWCVCGSEGAGGGG